MFYLEYLIPSEQSLYMTSTLYNKMSQLLGLGTRDNIEAANLDNRSGEIIQLPM